ncbi:hypothetical protein L1887_32270 [Cichorium endivia]|nr:hypothetical protein L1887_32270 [Cichorium endivia]
MENICNAATPLVEGDRRQKRRRRRRQNAFVILNPRKKKRDEIEIDQCPPDTSPIPFIEEQLILSVEKYPNNPMFGTREFVDGKGGRCHGAVEFIICHAEVTLAFVEAKKIPKVVVLSDLHYHGSSYTYQRESEVENSWSPYLV